MPHGGGSLAARTLTGAHLGSWPGAEKGHVVASWPRALLDVAGDAFLHRLADHLHVISGADAVWICACIERGGARRLQGVVNWTRAGGAELPFFDPDGTPCQQVLAQGYVEMCRGVQAGYPSAPMARLGYDGLLGIALGEPAEAPVGLILLLTRPMQLLPIGFEGELRTFARRAAGELRSYRARTAAEEQLGFLQRLLDAIPNPVFFKDVGLRYRECNRAFAQMLGRPRSEILGKSVFDLVPEEYAELNHQSDLLTLERGQLVYENGMRFADGSRREVIYSKAALYANEGGASGVVGTIQDISAQRRAEREVFRLTNYDAITGLPNRSALLECLETFCGDAAPPGRWVMALDIDKFHALHAGVGHDGCNTLLALLGERLAGLVAERGLAARIGGDKFGLCWFEPLDADAARARAEQVRQLLVEPFPLAGQQLHATVCLGLAQAQPGDHAEGLLRCAETALRQAKQAGRSNFQFFARELGCAAMQQIALEADLRHALGRREFSLVYQPQVDLSSGTVVGLEALLRWQQPQRGAVPPDHFIPVAEETGLIHPIGRWVLEEACRQARAWQLRGLPPLRVAVNVSGRQLQQAGFCAMVHEILESAGLDPGWLELELTESTVMEHTEENIRILDGLKALGVHLSIDDFGTGYSSLAYLQRFPIDKLKIDRAFIADLPSANGDKAIAEAIIALAQGLGLKVVAEGVETAAQAEFLLQRNCCLIQGYFSGRPMTPDGVVALLARQG